MTRQEIFDKAAYHLVDQGKQSLTEDGARCVYRGVGGKRCAVGILIRDWEYDKRIEHHGISSLIYNPFVSIPSIEALAKHAGLLSLLQQLHDAKSSWNNENGGIVAALEKFAKTHSLEHWIKNIPVKVEKAAELENA